MSSVYWLIPIGLGLCFLLWAIRGQARDLFVFTTFSRPGLFRYLPYMFDRASRFLVENPQGYIERHPIKVVHAFQTIATNPDARLRNEAMQAIVDNIGSVAQLDEAEAARALLTVIDSSDASSLTHHRALILRPAIIDSLAKADPVQAVLLAQRGVATDGGDEKIHNQSCELVLRHLDRAFGAEPIVAAHAACNIARKTHAETRDSAIWMLLAHMSMITDADSESGHAAAEQAVLLSTIGTALHQAALDMWEWHMRQILLNNPSQLIAKIFYGFGISTAAGPNKWDLYERGFDFLMNNPAVIKDYPEDVVRISLCIGLRANQNPHLYQKAVIAWTAGLQELCGQNLRLAIRAANEAMTYTAPGSQFEQQAQIACRHLKQLDANLSAQPYMI